MPALLLRWSWVAALGAAIVWLLVWAHQTEAHGTTELNEQQIVLGLTWMDSAKFLVVSFALLVPGLEALRARSQGAGRLAHAGFMVTYAALAALALGTALEFWSFPWGSYAKDFEEPLPTYGGILQVLASLTLTVGALVLASVLGRRRVLPIVLGLVLVAGAAGTFYLTPVLPVSGLAWVVLGAALWRCRQALPVARASR